MNILISFVVPVYNGAKTIERCMRSICDLGRCDIEILVVDDGSTDDTATILDALAQEDSRITAVHIPNGGVSNARNTAFQRAAGKYVAFVDCDDLVLDGYASVFSLLAQQDYDLVLCDFITNRRGVRQRVRRSKLAAGENSCEKLYQEVALGRFNNIWCNIYKTDLIQQHQLTFHSRMKMGEDAAFNLDYVELCKSCYCEDQPIYEYMDDNDASAMHHYQLSYLSDHIELFDRQQEFLHRHGLAEGFAVDDYMVSRIFGTLFCSSEKIDSKISHAFETSLLRSKMVGGQLKLKKSKIKRTLVLLGLYRIEPIRAAVGDLLAGK